MLTHDAHAPRPPRSPGTIPLTTDSTDSTDSTDTADTADLGVDAPRRRPKPMSRAWPVSRVVLVVGMALVAAMLAALVALFMQDRRQAVELQRERNAMYARLLQEQVARQIDAVAVSLEQLGSMVAAQGLSSGALSVIKLEQMLISLPQLRGVAVVDLHGHVLASNALPDIGRRVDLTVFGALPDAGRNEIGPFVAGRGLEDLATDRAIDRVMDRAASAAPPSHGFMPLLRRVQLGGDAGELLLVALISTESLANQMRLTIADASSRVLLVGWDALPHPSAQARLFAGLYADTDTEANVDGTLVCATANASVCQRLAVHPGLLKYLPTTEFASFVGAGASPGEQIVAFRSLRAWPLLVLVERPLATVLSEWLEAHVWRWLVSSLAVLAVAALTMITARSLRAREKVRRDLDRAQIRSERSAREIDVIVRSVQQLLFRTDVYGTLTYVNAHGPLVVGGLFEGVLGKRFDTLVKADEQELVRSMFCRDRGAAVRCVTVTIGAARPQSAQHGPVRRFDVAIVALYDGRRVVGFAGSAVDITEREEAQTLLAEQLAFSALLLELIPLPTAMWDSNGRYLSVNRAWLEFGGRSRRANAIGRSVMDGILPGEANQHFEKDRELLALTSGSPLGYETQFTHPDGSTHDLVVNKVVVPGRDGAPYGILCTFSDVTQLRNAARATQEARAAAEESSRAKSEFLANISHELRTPLQAILGFSELGTLPGRSRDAHAAMFTDIHGAGRRMLALVNDLLDVAKMDSAVGINHLERADLHPLLREVAHELQPSLKARQLLLDTSLPAQPLLARVDPKRFQQVVRNVLANAIKFAPAGSTIVLVAQREGGVSGEERGDAGSRESGATHLSVRDHGPGIPPAELEQIFESFVQSSLTKDGSGGTGLGLAICRTIMAAHGGTICAENMPDGGSRFHIRLPALRRSAEPRAAALEH